MQTISLHNIRYEWRREGEELWRIVDGRAELVGRVHPIAEGRRWGAIAYGSPVESFLDQETACLVVEAAVKGLKNAVTKLT